MQQSIKLSHVMQYAMHNRKIVVFSMNYLPAVFLLKISQV